MMVRGMVLALAAMMACAAGAEAAPRRDARGKHDRAAAPAALRPIQRGERVVAVLSPPRLEPVRRGERIVATLPLERFVPVSASRRFVEMPRGWEARPRWEPASRFAPRAEPRRSTGGDRWTATGAVRSVGFFSRPAFAAPSPVATRDDDDDDRRVAIPRGRGGSWHAGVPAADREQRDCPAGTMSVLARGHADTFRCVPI